MIFNFSAKIIIGLLVGIIAFLGFLFYKSNFFNSKEAEILNPQQNQGLKYFPGAFESEVSDNHLIKSVRLGLSSIEMSKDFNKFTDEVLNHLIEVGANTVFITPWSDGYANYNSSIAQKSVFGQQSYVDNFIEQAQAMNIQVYVWFVVGKDNFPAQIHPEWFSETINGENYLDEDEPDIFLPMASLANQEYLDYHLKLLEEVNQLPIDGWVISEPLASWGDRYDETYADFSESVNKKFLAKTQIEPKLLFDEFSLYFYEENPSLYKQWVDFRAEIVTNFVAQSINEIRKSSDKPIIITIFTEPDKNGQLVSFDSLKEWLGMDINALAELKPDYLEIQGLFLDFEFPQKPEWLKDMIKQFRLQFKHNIPLMMSIQGFDSNDSELSADDFSVAISSAISESIDGISFYAYHTLRKEHWTALKEIWNPY